MNTSALTSCFAAFVLMLVPVAGDAQSSSQQLQSDVTRILQELNVGKDTVALGISAAGTTQATATPLTAQFNEVTTVAAGAGVALPAGTLGAHVLVHNSGANALTVYPRNGDNASINALTANTPMIVQVNTTGYFESMSTTRWYTAP